MKFTKLLFFGVLFLLAPSVLSMTEGFKLVDKVCMEVGSKPLLKSRVEARAKRDGISPKLAEDILKREFSLEEIATRLLKVDLSQIKRIASQHVAGLAKKNGLSDAEFREKLKEGNMTYDQLVQDTENNLIQSQIMAEQRKKVVIADDDLKKAVAKAHEFEIVFISIRKTGAASADFIKAKEIKKQVGLLKSLDKVKSMYENDESVSFIGPKLYEKDMLLKIYEEKLQEYAHQEITEPFVDKEAFTMIWKIKNKILDHNLSETALEKERNKLYEEATKQLFDTVVSSELANSPVVSNCDW